MKVAGMKSLQFSRPGPRVRLRGGRLRRGRAPRVQGRRSAGHPLRRPARRPRHARDAVHHLGSLRPGHGRQGGADHRRPLLRRHTRLLHRPCRSGSGGRRTDRPAEATATSSRSMPKPAPSPSSCRTRNWPSAARPGLRASTTSSPARSGNMPRSWVMPRRVR